MNERRPNVPFWLTLFSFSLAVWSAWRWYNGIELAWLALAVNIISGGICWWLALKVRAINRQIAAQQR